LLSIVTASACSRRSISYNPDGAAGNGGSGGGGGMDPCSAISVAQCTQYTNCEIITLCTCDNTGGQICVSKGTINNCTCGIDCTKLTETQCKQNSSVCRADYCSACGCGSPSFAGCVDVGAPPSVCPFKCPAGICCDGLDETSCKTKAGCTPNYCVGCNGVEAFSGCTGPGEGAPACNNSCGCRDQSDCTTSGGVCVAPGDAPGCGVCQVPCTSDGDCGQGTVCDQSSCVCPSSGGSKACIQSCLTSGCPEGELCGNDGHCAPSSCASFADCPAFFDCVMPKGAGSQCQRRGCGTDSACGSGGYCVKGACYSMLGTCQPPVP
jgi:hypothetical protein